MTDLFEQRLRAAARAIPTPEPPTDLIERVVAERASGRRAILPTTTAPWFRRTRFRLGLAGAIAAAVVAVFVATRQRSDGVTVVSNGVFIGTAFAEQVKSAPAAMPLRLSGTSWKARRYTYSLDYIDAGGRASHDGDGSLDVSSFTHDGAAAWRIAFLASQTEAGQFRTIAETLVVSRDELVPLTRAVHVRPYLRYSSINIAQRFAGDSVIGAMTTDGGVRRPIARRLPEGFAPFLTDALAPLALMGTPLSSATTGSLSILGWAVVPGDLFSSVTIRAIGEEHLATKAGVFDCWKLEVVAGREHRIEWVRKSDGLGIRSDDTRETPRGHRRFELLDP